MSGSWEEAAGELTELVRLVRPGGVVVLSGAGLSTESGIPDYRGPTGQRVRATPMTYDSFVGDPAARQRYWARSYLGWRTIATAEPNAGHRAVATLEQAGMLDGIVTQNVDGLHQAAGARNVIELHGGLDRVVCLGCGARSPRVELDERLREANPSFTARTGPMKPDGDVDLASEAVEAFTVVACTGCGGMLKPDVVFFGETVPRDRVQACFALVESARALLVLGSSLTVMSGRRFVLRAAKMGVRVAIVNQGATRGDDYASVRVEGALGQTLATLVTRIKAVGGEEVPVGSLTR